MENTVFVKGHHRYLAAFGYIALVLYLNVGQLGSLFTLLLAMDYNALALGYYFLPGRNDKK
jgi:hypothetical protein